MNYLRRRLEERSTWTAIGATVTAAALVPSPYSWIAIGVGVIAVLCPSPGAGNG
jgi:hypothetical protein